MFYLVLNYLGIKEDLEGYLLCYITGFHLIAALPCMCVVACGTKMKCLLICCIATSAFDLLQCITLVILVLLSGLPEVTAQFISILSIIGIHVISLAILVATLKIRQKEQAALHRAMLIPNKRKNEPLLV